MRALTRGRRRRAFGLAWTTVLVAAAVAAACTPDEPVLDATVPPPGGSVTMLDTAYGPEPVQRFDAYLRGPSPEHVLPKVVVWVHGGSWSGGDKSNLRDPAFRPLLDRLQREGFAVFSVNYRLTGTAPSPAQTQDVALAVSVIRERAKHLGVDARFVAVMGDSAGGHLAQLLATSNGDPELRGDVSQTQVQAAVSFYGISDLAALPEQSRRQGCPDPDLLTEAVAAYTSGQAAMRSHTSPLVRLRGGMAGTTDKIPVMLLHGTRDCVVPTAQSTTMHDELVRRGVPTDLVVADAEHEGTPFVHDPATLDRIVAFVRRAGG